MNKIKISNQAIPFHMPMSIVSAVVDGKVNHMAVGWLNRVNFKPPMVGVSLGKTHYTNRGIREHKTFGVSIPDVGLLKAADYAGLVSGSKVDKSRLFEIFYGEVENAPMVTDCPLTMACRVVQTIELPTNEIFIGEIIESYCAEEFIAGNAPDMDKLKLFTLTIPDNRYWAVGECIGKAWSAGKGYKIS